VWLKVTPDSFLKTDEEEKAGTQPA